MRHRILAIVAMVSIASCAESATVFMLDGSWHLEESLADEIHLVSCVGTGSITVTQRQVAESAAGPSGPSTSFSAVAGVDTDCVGQDGPFNYFGDGVFTQGTVTPGPTHSVHWSGTVNTAVCEYEGVVSGDGAVGLGMSGTMVCVLDITGVTFNFEGTWQAWSSKSEWCAARAEQPGCQESAG